MARSWGELLGEADAPPEPEEARGGLFSRLRDSLAKSRRALTEQIQAAAFDPGDDAAWERLEEALIGADVGVLQRHEARQHLDHADLGAERPPQRGELDADGAAAQHHRGPGDVVERGGGIRPEV